MAGFQLHVDDDLPARFVDNIIAFAVRHDFVAVIREKLVQVCQGILKVGRLVLLRLLVKDGRTHEITGVESGEDDLPQSRRVVELADTVFCERPSRRESRPVCVIGAELIEKTD